MTNPTPPSASTDNEQEDELREAIIHKLGLERTLQEQLIPSNMEDFMSDWSFTVDDILSLIARHTKEAERRARIDEHHQITEHGKRLGFGRLDLIVEYQDGTNSGVLPYRQAWNDAYDRFINTSNSRMAELAAPQQSKERSAE